MQSTDITQDHHLKVHRATICSPTVLQDRTLTEAVQSRFGIQPLPIVGVSSRFYRRFGESDHEHPMRLVIRGSDQGRVMVMLLQFSGHQLRCVASLRSPSVQAMLASAQTQGSVPMVLVEDDGHRYAGLECGVPPEDLEAIAALGKLDIARARDCRAELSYAALSCLLKDEVPSIVPGEQLRHWDVAMVEDEASTT